MAKAKKKFGGYGVNFKGCTETREDIMESTPIGPAEMTKKLWAYVKSKKLGSKS